MERLNGNNKCLYVELLLKGGYTTVKWGVLVLRWGSRNLKIRTSSITLKGGYVID